jgi:hypothetical protein
MLHTPRVFILLNSGVNVDVVQPVLDPQDMELAVTNFTNIMPLVAIVVFPRLLDASAIDGERHIRDPSEAQDLEGLER